MINVFELLLLKNPHVITLLLKDTRQHTGSKCILAVFRCHQVEESLNEMDFQLFLDLYFTDGDYTWVLIPQHVSLLLIFCSSFRRGTNSVFSMFLFLQARWAKFTAEY